MGDSIKRKDVSVEKYIYLFVFFKKAKVSISQVIPLPPVQILLAGSDRSQGLVDPVHPVQTVVHR